MSSIFENHEGRSIEKMQEVVKKRKEKDKKIRKNVLEIGSLILLLAVCIWSFVFVQKGGLQEFFQVGNDLLAEEEEKEGQIRLLTGTVCTIKSNSLDGVPLMAEAGSGNEISLIPEGKCAEVICGTRVDDKVWIKVDYCGLTGWVKSSQVNPLSEENVYIRPGSTVFVNRITELGLKAYNIPNNDGTIVADGFHYGSEFEVEELVDGWAKVYIGDTPAYINMYHMGSYPVDIWKVETLSSAKEINFRTSPDTTSESIDKIPEGSSLVMLEYEDGWGYTEYHGQRGWVMLHYLTPVGESEEE